MKNKKKKENGDSENFSGPLCGSTAAYSPKRHVAFRHTVGRPKKDEAVAPRWPWPRPKWARLSPFYLTRF